MLNSSSPYNDQSAASWWFDILLLFIFFASLYFIMLGNRPLFVPDEGRYAEIAREMSLSNDFVTPYLNYIKYFEKPPLFYWLGTAAIKVFGLSITSIRSVNAFLAIIGCLITYATGRQLYGRRAGWISALILGTSMLYFVMAHMISLDLTVTLFLSGSLYAFILAAKASSSPRTQQLLTWGSAAMAACAVLTKGLIGIVFPAMIVGSWIVFCSQWQILKRLPILSGMFLFLLIAAPWHILVNYRNPEFFYFYFIEQHILRYTSMKIGHYQPVWFFIPIFIAAFFPWVIMLPAMLWRMRPRATEVYFLLWASLIFIFFSFSKSKLIPYILPVIPPLAILMGHYINITYKNTLPILVAAVCVWGFLLSMAAIAPAYDTRTILPLAAILKPKLTPTADVITYNQYYQDLPFYLERRVSILNWKNELTYGMLHQDTHAWMINDIQFWQRWHSKQPIYVFLSDEELANFQKDHPNEKVHLLGQINHNKLISNH